MNKVILLGRTGNAVDMHYFEGGGCVGKCTFATSRKYKKKDSGELVEETQWHNLVFKNKVAEIASKYAEKGKQLLIEGSINYRKYERDGQTRYFTEIIVLNMQLLGGKTEPKGGKSETTPQGGAAQPNSFVDGDNPDDDLPF